jgi:subtilisin family serine protease
MRLRRRPELRVIALLLIVAAAVYVAVQGRANEKPVPTAVTWRGLVGDEHPPVDFGNQQIVVLKTPSLAQHLAQVHYATEQQERVWTQQVVAAQQQVLVALAAHGFGGRPDYTYSRVLDGFSESLDPRAVALLEQDPQVVGVYPVRAAFPATISSSALSGVKSAALQLPGFDGQGVTVALLDTGVDASQPYLHGRVLPGIDVLGGDAGAGAEPNPQEPSELERHGTELAGLIVGAGGPRGIHGVAPGANLLPIRIAGWQKDATGRDVVYSRSDQLIAGLDRAVDPNGDGDAHDAARVAIIGMVEPFASFDDSPEAQAVAGALALDTLVVTPAGNDGVAGPLYGSIAGPAGSPASLTVGATDARATTPTVRIALWRGLDVVLDRDLPLLDLPSSKHPVDLPVAVASGSGTKAADYFARGLNLVAGKAALVPAGSDPGAAANAAAGAGAKAVLLFGAGLPAGSLGLSNDLGIPVVAVPSSAAAKLLAAHRAGDSIGVALGGVQELPNALVGRVAPFSSLGLALDGLPKPDLVAPGVGLATSDPGSDAQPEPSFTTVAGTSVSAATIAGAAALLAEARPALTAPQLASVLAGSAGAGRQVDVGASAAVEVAASSTSLGFGNWTNPHWHATRELTIDNVSTRRLVLNLQSLGSRRSENLRFLVKPDHFALSAGHSRKVWISASATESLDVAVESGEIVVRPVGAQSLRVPWAIGFTPKPETLIPRATIASASFEPSTKSPTLLTVQVGRVDVSSGLQIQAASRLDVLLYKADGAYVGLLARERDLLPGTYTFAITGHGPSGMGLAPGRYQLRLVAWPTELGPPSRALVRFQLE